MTGQLNAASVTTAAASSSDSTPTRIAKYTIASSVGVAALTAVYEATFGRSRARKEQTQQAASGAETVARVSLPRGDAQPRHRLSTGLLAASAALNSGVVAFTFFSVREYVISPALEYSRKRWIQGDTEHTLPTWTSTRAYHVHDSALTGALLGSAFNMFRVGFPGILPGALTASLACTALQLVVNEAYIQRIRFVSKYNEPAPEFLSNTASPSLGAHSVSDQALQSQSESSLHLSKQQEGQGRSQPLGERLLAFIGVKKLSDEEYIERLRERRATYEKRIAELEALVAAGEAPKEHEEELKK